MQNRRGGDLYIYPGFILVPCVTRGLFRHRLPRTLDAPLAVAVRRA
jgi:hypothetical protein